MTVPDPTDDAAGITRSATGMGAAAALSRAFGGVRMVVIAAVLGTTYLGNTFQASNSISNVLFELLAAGALSAVLVPTFVDLFARGASRDAEEVAGGLLSVALVALGVVSILGIVFAPQLADALTASVANPIVAAQQQELATFLLRFFIPQVMLYAVGAVSTAILNARGSFALAAAAPIGNTIVLVTAMLVFRALAGEHPGLDLTTGERACLAAGGTLGVAAFIAVPAVALRMSGFRMRFGWRRAISDSRVRQLVRLSGWAALQHSGVAILLAAALVVSGGVAGGVVAYQLAMVVFLAPYGILAQPIHTTALPELARKAAVGDLEGLGVTLRWAMNAMAAVTLPVAAGLVALSLPVMRLLAFGEAADGDGPRLLAASLAGLAIGIPMYGAFLLLSRASYALGDSRTPALAALGSSVLGAGAMLAAGLASSGPARLAIVGGGHTIAYALGAMWLGHRLRGRVGRTLSPTLLRPLVASAAVGCGAWLAMSAWSPDGRAVTAVAVAIIGAAGGVTYLLLMRLVGAQVRLRRA
jgi:putative peptidoglycan lipid II flippase